MPHAKSQTYLWMRIAVSSVLVVLFFAATHFTPLWRTPPAVQVPKAKIQLVERVLGVKLRKSQLTLSEVQQLVYWADAVEILQTRKEAGWGVSSPILIANETLPFSVIGKTSLLKTKILRKALLSLKRSSFSPLDIDRDEYLRVLARLTGAGLYYKNTYFTLPQIAFVYLSAEEELSPGPLDWVWARIKLQFVAWRLLWPHREQTL